MTKESKTASPEPVETVQAAPEAVRLSLDDFCIRLSETVRRPTLIGGFNADQKAGGFLAGTEAEFRARYEEFVNKPV